MALKLGTIHDQMTGPNEYWTSRVLEPQYWTSLVLESHRIALNRPSCFVNHTSSGSVRNPITQQRIIHSALIKMLKNLHK